jgi:tetratricopeptide (TPR) repeat protein
VDASRLQRLRQFQDRDPANRKLALDAASTARTSGDLQAEQEILFKALQAIPGDTELSFLLGTNFLARGAYRLAANEFQALLSAGNDHPATRYNLAYAFFNESQHAKAREVLDGLSEGAWEQTPEAHKLYARVCHFLEDLAPGIEHLRRYSALQPDDPDAQGLLALMLFDADRSEEARLVAEQVLARKADDPNARLALGGIALEEQNGDVVLEFLGPIVERLPTHGRAWSGIAFGHLLRLDLPSARSAFEHAVQHMPGHIGTWHGLAWVQILTNHIDGAKESLDRAMALDRNFADTHGGLAVVAALQGRDDEAQVMIRRALGLNRQSFAARFAQSLLLGKAGRRELSSKIIQTLISSPMSPGAKPLKEMVASLMTRDLARRAKPTQSTRSQDDAPHDE